MQLPNIHITNGAGTRLKGHPAFLDITLDEDLLDLVSCVIGDDIVMWGCQFAIGHADPEPDRAAVFA